MQNDFLIKDFIKKIKEGNEGLLKNKTLPIIGWCNTYVPEEIIIASGAIPYRIMGAPIPIRLSKTYLSGNLSANIQSLLECALRGDYKFLDGMVVGASTDSTKRIFDAWVNYSGIPFNFLFDIPKFVYENSHIHYEESIYSLIEEIEKNFKINITKSSISKAISLCNKTRALLTDLNNLRKLDIPPISSQMMLEVCKLAMLSEKSFFNNELELLLNKIEVTNGKDASYRVLLTGSFQDQPWLLEIIEENNAKVVCEDLCTRLRYFFGLVDEDIEPVEAISKRYLKKKLPSATLVSFDMRISYLSDLVQKFRIDAVVYYILKFDDPYLFEFPDMKNYLDLKNIPVIRIETDYNTSAIGQVRTRLQAFFETLKIKSKKNRKVKANG